MSNKNTDQKVPRVRSLPSTFTITLSMSRLLTGVFLLFAGIGWAFILGIMVGRGYQLQKTPALTSLLPDSQMQQAEDQGKIMKPEELTFMNTLRDKKPVNGTQALSTPTSTGGATASNPNVAQQSAVPGKAPSQKEAKPERKEPSKPVYNYVFQVASFKQEDPVYEVRQRLEEAGMRTRMVREKSTTTKTTWFRALVLFRGTEDGAAKLRKELAAIKMGTPLLRSKTPVSKKKQ